MDGVRGSSGGAPAATSGNGSNVEQTRRQSRRTFEVALYGNCMRARSQHEQQSVLPDSLVSQEGLGQRIQALTRRRQQQANRLLPLRDHVLHFLIDSGGSRIAVVTPLSQLIAEKRLFLVGLERHRSQTPHPPARDH